MYLRRLIGCVTTDLSSDKIDRGDDLRRQSVTTDERNKQEDNSEKEAMVNNVKSILRNYPKVKNRLNAQTMEIQNMFQILD